MARSPSHKSPRRNRRGRRSILKTALLGSAIALIPITALSVGGFLAYQHLNTEKIDATYCYDRDDQFQTAAFVDFSFTHQISPSQRRDLVNTLTQAYRSMPPNGKLSVFTTANGSTASVNTPVFTLCNPPENATEQARIEAPGTSATKLAREHAEAMGAFSTFVEDLISKSADQSQVAASSPILEQLQGISRYDFGAPLGKLFAYTDGLNNSQNGQFCAKQNELPGFAVFATRPGYRFVAPENFDGAEIDILLVEGAPLPQPNLPYCTNAELRGFWVDYFEANGAGTVRLTPLGYGAGQ